MEPAEGSPGVTFPKGFLAGGVTVGLKQSGRPDMGRLRCARVEGDHRFLLRVHDERVCGGAGRRQQEECDLAHLVAVAVNSGNANACTG